jgi:hypothetical protein
VKTKVGKYIVLLSSNGRKVYVELRLGGVTLSAVNNRNVDFWLWTTYRGANFILHLPNNKLFLI